MCVQTVEVTANNTSYEKRFSGNGRGRHREVLLSALIPVTFPFTISGLQQWPMPFLQTHKFEYHLTLII